MKIPEVKVDTSEVDELMLDLLSQACGIDSKEIDNECLSVYEEACDYLTTKGYLKTTNGRIYQIIKQKHKR